MAYKNERECLTPSKHSTTRTPWTKAGKNGINFLPYNSCELSLGPSETTLGWPFSEELRQIKTILMLLWPHFSKSIILVIVKLRTAGFNLMRKYTFTQNNRTIILTGYTRRTTRKFPRLEAKNVQ